MNKYLTHLPVSEYVVEKLIKEFYDNVHKAKIYTASNGVITRSLDEMEVIRLADAEDCVLAHKIAKNLSYMIAAEVKPRYYRQAAGSDLNKHKDVGATIALNIVLEGSGPICFDDDIYINYKCALLDVTQYHSVKTEDTRVLFRLTANDISYEEVLDCIEGKEHDIFDIN
jgi:hypothetical protein